MQNGYDWSDMKQLMSRSGQSSKVNDRIEAVKEVIANSLITTENLKKLQQMIEKIHQLKEQEKRIQTLMKEMDKTSKLFRKMKAFRLLISDIKYLHEVLSWQYNQKNNIDSIDNINSIERNFLSLLNLMEKAGEMINNLQYINKTDTFNYRMLYDHAA